MSSVGIKDASNATRQIDTFVRTEGPDQVETQAVAIVNPTTGDPLLPTAGGAMPVAGTFWQATQPVSLAAMPLPNDAATDSGLAAVVAALGTPLQAGGSVAVSNFPGTQPVSGTFWQATQPVSFTWAGLTDAQLRAAAVPVSGTFWQATQPISASELPLPAGAATQATLASVDSKLPALDGGRVPVVLPAGGGGLTDSELRAAPVLTEVAPPVFVRVGFAEVGSGLQGNAASELTLVRTGSGMAVSQAAGNLVITTGTTANSETIIRSQGTFKGSLLARVKVILSQRIANNIFRFELADLVGTALAFTINSATSVTVTFPSVNPFSAMHVGQSLRLSDITGAAGIPGRFAIASVAGLTVTFTVAAWPASGSGTLTLYGYNFISNEYSGTTATNSSFDAQRRGWASGNTTATINNTASPGHVAQLAFDVNTSGLADALVASNTGYQWTQRASRIENLPDEDVDLYLFIVVQNGASAPASSTTLTVGFIQVEDQGRQKVRIASADPVGSHAQPVQVMGGTLGTQPVSGSVTATLAAAAVRAGCG